MVTAPTLILKFRAVTFAVMACTALATIAYGARVALLMYNVTSKLSAVASMKPHVMFTLEGTGKTAFACAKTFDSVPNKNTCC